MKVCHRRYTFSAAMTIATGQASAFTQNGFANEPIFSASFVNMQSLELMAIGHMIADFIAIIGTVDAVLGDSDR